MKSYEQKFWGFLLIGNKNQSAREERVSLAQLGGCIGNLIRIANRYFQIFIILLLLF